MISKSPIAVVVNIAMTVLLITACESVPQVAPNEPPTDLILVTPGNASKDVGLYEKITLTFPTPMEPTLVERDFRIIRSVGSPSCEAHDDTCTDDMEASGTSGLSGRFIWNETFTRCTFVPDRALEPGTTYTVFVGTATLDTLMRRHTASGMSHNGRNGMSHDGQNGMSHDGQNGMSHDGQNGMSHDGQNGMSHDGQNGMSHDGQNGMSHDGQHCMSDQSTHEHPMMSTFTTRNPASSADHDSHH